MRTWARLGLIWLFAAALAACGRAPASPDRGLDNPNCLTREAAAKLEASQVTPGAAKRLAQHYGGCLYDADGAVRWMRFAADRGDPEAMTYLATLLEGRDGPAAKTEAAELRTRAARIEEGNVH